MGSIPIVSLTTRVLKGKREKKPSVPYVRLSAELDEMQVPAKDIKPSKGQG